MIGRLLFFIIPFLFWACAGGDDVRIPDDILDAHTFTGVMIDVQLSEGMSNQSNYVRNHSGKIQQRDPYASIFEKHHITAAEFKRTYEFYSLHPDKMEIIYEQVLDSLSKLDVEIKQRFTQEERARNDSLRKSNQRRSDSLRVLPKLRQIK